MESEPSLDPDLNPDLEIEAPSPDAKPEVSLEDIPDPDAAPAPELESFVVESFEDIKLDAVPEASRPWVSRMAEAGKAIVARERAAVAGRMATLDASIKAWDDLTSSVRDTDDKGTALAEVIKAERAEKAKLQEDLRTLQVESSEATWNLFESRNQGYDDVPQATKDKFIALIPNLDMFDGRTEVDRLESAFKFAQFSTGHWPPAQRGGQPRTVVDEDEDAGKASLISAGTRAPVVNRPDIASRSPQEILDEYDHLLRD